MFRTALVCLSVLLTPAAALAQGAPVAFGGLKHDKTLPVEVTSDQLNVDQSDGTAIFTGNVVIGQGEMRITARRVDVFYETVNGETTGRIQRMLATGDVVMVNGAEAAEGERAEYTIDTGNVVMTGDVLLTQGQNALSGDRLVIDLDTGTGVMEGRVKTIFQPGSSQ